MEQKIIKKEFSNRVEYYNERGQLHRDGDPAVEYANGTKIWYRDGQRHRLDGPAVESADGSKSWWQNDQLHRLNGPAMEGANGNGNKEWYQNGELHREDGPACEYVDGSKEWYLKGKEHSEEEFLKKMNLSKITKKELANRVEYHNEQSELHRDGDPAVEWTNGDKEWFQNGLRHRLDGPAIEYVDGSKEWFQNNLRHREGGPAIEQTNGDKLWYRNNQWHRLDGPAIERANGSKLWFLEGKEYSEEEFMKKINLVKTTKKELSDRIEYRNEQGLWHRLDGPAVEWKNGNKSWFQNGLRHRLDGPAIERADGEKKWFLEGIQYSEKYFLTKVNKAKNTFIDRIKQSSLHQKDNLNKNTKKSRFKSNLVSGTELAVARKATKIVQAGLLKAIKSNLEKNNHFSDEQKRSYLEGMKIFLSTPAGQASIGMILSLVMGTLPITSNIYHQVTDAIAVNSIAQAEELSIDFIMKHLKTEMTNLFNTSKKTHHSFTRVKTLLPSLEEEEEIIEFKKEKFL